MADAISNSEPHNSQQRKETLAVFEGHDADFPTEDQASKPAADPSSLESAISPISSNTRAPHEPLPVKAAEKQAIEAQEKNDKIPSEKDIEAIGLEKDLDVEAGRSSVSISDVDDAQVQPTDPVDPNVVDWDGPNDSENPVNWTAGKKWSNIAIMAAITFLTYVAFTLFHVTPMSRSRYLLYLRPLASTMFAPAIPLVQAEFHNNNEELASFVISVYILGFAFGPLVCNSSPIVLIRKSLR